MNGIIRGRSLRQLTVEFDALVRRIDFLETRLDQLEAPEEKPPVKKAKKERPDA